MSDEVRTPSETDLNWLLQAESHILELMRRHYGHVSLAHTEADLQLAQRVIDDRLVEPGQPLELQCLGVVLGNVFAAQTSMQWAVVTNEFGTMLALHSPVINSTLYPLTMISKRVASRRNLNIPALYRSFVADLRLSIGRG